MNNEYKDVVIYYDKVEDTLDVVINNQNNEKIIVVNYLPYLDIRFKTNNNELNIVGFKSKNFLTVMYNKSLDRFYDEKEELTSAGYSYIIGITQTLLVLFNNGLLFIPFQDNL